MVKMEYINENKCDKSYRLLGYMKILDAICHFDCHEDLDERTFFITLKVVNSSSLKRKQHIYDEVCRCIKNSGVLDSKLDPGVTLDNDFAESRQLNITSELPHLHGLIVLPCKVSLDGLEKIANAIDWRLEQMSFVKKSKTQVYEPSKSLGYTQDYAAKFGKISSAAANPPSDNGEIFPIDKVRLPGKRGTNMYNKWQRRADSLRIEFFWDPQLFFSDRYFLLFGIELAEISKIRLYNKAGDFGEVNRQCINKKRYGNRNMLMQAEHAGHIDQELDRLPIQNFASCEKWAKDITMRYRWIRSNEINWGDASRWLIQRVFHFAERMEHEGKLPLIHKSTVRRLRNVRIQDRSSWGIVMLLLAAEDRGLFTRSVRHRASKGASKLICDPVPLSKSARLYSVGDSQSMQMAA